MSRFPEQKPNGISLEKALDDHEAKVRELANTHLKILLYGDILAYMGEYEYKPTLYDSERDMWEQP